MNIPDKTTGDQLTGAEFTEFKNELANQIIALGLTPASNSIQLKESIAMAVASGASHTDGGSANAYSLEAKGAQAIVTAYQDGQVFTFKATNSNTGISTLAIAGLSAKAIKKDGFANDLASGDIVAGKIYSVYYDSGQDKFELVTVVPAIASEAEAEAGTENTKMMTALRVAQAIKGIAIAYCTVSGGVITVEASTGFTSITRTSTGVFVATLDTSPTDYACLLTCSNASNRGYSINDKTRVGSVITIEVRNDTATAVDPVRFTIEIKAV